VVVVEAGQTGCIQVILKDNSTPSLDPERRIESHMEYSLMPESFPD
jgi:hypothetical protein